MTVDGEVNFIEDAKGLVFNTSYNPLQFQTVAKMHMYTFLPDRYKGWFEYSGYKFLVFEYPSSYWVVRLEDIELAPTDFLFKIFDEMGITKHA